MTPDEAGRGRGGLGGGRPPRSPVRPTRPPPPPPSRAPSSPPTRAERPATMRGEDLRDQRRRLVRRPPPTRGADWVGFVFFPPSPRAVTPAEAAAIDRAAPRRRPAARRPVRGRGRGRDPSRPPRPCIWTSCSSTAASPPAAALRDRLGVHVWRAVGASTQSDLPGEPGDADAPGDRAEAAAGGHEAGRQRRVARLDYAARLVRSPSPWLLGGGLTPGQRGRRGAGRQAPRPWTSRQGVERAPGRKDAALIRRFVEAARGG